MIPVSSSVTSSSSPKSFCGATKFHGWITKGHLNRCPIAKWWWSTDICCCCFQNFNCPLVDDESNEMHSIYRSVVQLSRFTCPWPSHLLRWKPRKWCSRLVHLRTRLWVAGSGPACLRPGKLDTWGHSILRWVCFSRFNYICICLSDNRWVKHKRNTGAVIYFLWEAFVTFASEFPPVIDHNAHLQGLCEIDRERKRENRHTWI